jgi:hypothetical protein
MKGKQRVLEGKIHLIIANINRSILLNINKATLIV